MPASAGMTSVAFFEVLYIRLTNCSSDGLFYHAEASSERTKLVEILS